ncbi:SAM-dependent methyltransferase [Streptomyces sp. NBC_00467]|uniref:SAM-dependent methyltransferase n=1 Tax=Streptomyces sp. NBC_00467 TaxID=2975752 RepID=UPI002E17C88F
MIDIVVVLRAEDAVLDFLSVLTDPEAREVHVLCAGTAESVVLPAGSDRADRLAALARRERPVDEAAASPGSGPLAEAIGRAAAGPADRVWTHSPADNRGSRGLLGRDAATAAGDLSVLHAVGTSPYLQVVSDLDRPLDRDLVAAKLRFVNRHCGHLLRTDSAQHRIDTARVPATERFFAAGADERERLFALLAGLGDDAASVVDPWEFATSAYEQERLDATTSWIAGWCTLDDGPLIEVGACEGALTTRLTSKGFDVEATEPNALFRARLAERVAGEARVHPDDLETLAAERRLPGAAYLLIEMLYYGQDLGLLDTLPADLVFVALEPAALATRLRPWLAASTGWEQVDETQLVFPAVESVCGGRAYLRKRGSVGVLLRRTAS